MLPRKRSILGFLACLANLAVAPLAAQVPDGWFVVSSLATGPATPGGLFLLHPRIPGPPLIVQGLGPDLTGAGMTVPTGANSVAVEQETGLVLVGETGPPGTHIDLHRIRIVGNNATTLSTTHVGFVSFSVSGGGVTQIAMLPDGDAILSVADLANQLPLNGAMLARFSPTTGTLTPIPTPAISGYCNAVAVDADAGIIYFWLPFSSGGANGAVYAIPLPGSASRELAGGTARVVANVAAVAGLAVDSGGSIFATSFADLVTINPANGVVTRLGPIGANLNGLGLEAATDQPVTVLNGISSTPGVHWCTRAGVPTLLTTGIPAAGSGIAVRSSPRVYGTATPGDVAYLWRITPCPGGLPRLGNAGFGLAIDAFGSSPNPGLLFASDRPHRTPLLGVQVLLDLGRAISIGPITPGIPLAAPIPVHLPPGQELFFQAFFVDGRAPQGVVASDGQVVATIQ